MAKKAIPRKRTGPPPQVGPDRLYAPPKVPCGGCGGSAFHAIEGAPAWACSKCHPIQKGQKVRRRYEVMNEWRVITSQCFKCGEMVEHDRQISGCPPGWTWVALMATRLSTDSREKKYASGELALCPSCYPAGEDPVDSMKEMFR